MNITVQVDEISLATIIADTVAYDEDGDLVQEGRKTVADLVAEQIVGHLVKDDRYPRLRDEILNIRKEMIREALQPSIDKAINAPIRKTNSYGESTGGETTLRELIVDEVRKYLGEPADSYRREQGTVLQKTIRDQVAAAFKEEVAAAVKAARESVTKEIGDQLSAQVAEAVRKGMATR